MLSASSMTNVLNLSKTQFLHLENGDDMRMMLGESQAARRGCLHLTSFINPLPARADLQLTQVRPIALHTGFCF